MTPHQRALMRTVGKQLGKASGESAARATERLLTMRVKRVVTNGAGEVVAFEAAMSPQCKNKSKVRP